jgi:hypothetical protein
MRNASRDSAALLMSGLLLARFADARNDAGRGVGDDILIRPCGRNDAGGKEPVAIKNHRSKIYPRSRLSTKASLRVPSGLV